MNQINIFTDGGSRGNPGPSAVGAVIEIGGEKKKYGEFIGKATNNEAEYAALIFALKKTKQLIGKNNTKGAKLRCVSDSELMVKQLNGEYKLKDEKIQKNFIEIWNLKLDFGEISFEHTKRENNKEADAMVNEALDQENSRMF
ncbi:ribonuclease HI family protein [bacterium]|jgi:ribonuclease HI|nr:ribonuclease HI family protein [bacterium]MBT4251495.1 ribonuclease HI family protein [bacterium]MBT4597469.1 ribonuclease HI family protein [bacterium]MBT6754308.1 ribonuclease HI family protein [bacterium]MBT7037634.1 ribonuclease HI family protein [bacterium]